MSISDIELLLSNKVTYRNLKINNGFGGKKHSKEACAKFSALHKGKIISEETRAKMKAAALQNRADEREQGKQRCLKPVMTPNGVFPSRKAAAQAANVDPASINVWMKKWPKDYYYV